uniref:Uncharacterized protein n=1 Tax=Arundo donax TaxID=35708 RepID=A0A0A9HWR0_ARUDO
MPIVYDSEIVYSPRPFTSSDSKAAEPQKNSLVHASRDKQQASPSSKPQDVEPSTIFLCPSLEGDGNCMQGGAPSEEVIENTAAPISEFEVHLIRSTYLFMS